MDSWVHADSDLLLKKIIRQLASMYEQGSKFIKHSFVETYEIRLERKYF